MAPMNEPDGRKRVTKNRHNKAVETKRGLRLQRLLVAERKKRKQDEAQRFNEDRMKEMERKLESLDEANQALQRKADWFEGWKKMVDRSVVDRCLGRQELGSQIKGLEATMATNHRELSATITDLATRSEVRTANAALHHDMANLADATQTAFGTLGNALVPGRESLGRVSEKLHGKLGQASPDQTNDDKSLEDASEEEETTVREQTNSDNLGLDAKLARCHDPVKREPSLEPSDGCSTSFCIMTGSRIRPFDFTGDVIDLTQDNDSLCSHELQQYSGLLGKAIEEEEESLFVDRAPGESDSESEAETLAVGDTVDVDTEGILVVPDIHCGVDCCGRINIAM